MLTNTGYFCFFFGLQYWLISGFRAGVAINKILIIYSPSKYRFNFPVVSFTHANISFPCSFFPPEILVQNHSNDNDLNLRENTNLVENSTCTKQGYQKNWTGPVAWELYNGDATQNFGPELWAKFQIPVLWQKGKERDGCRKPWPWDFGHNYKLTITDPFPTAYTEYCYCFLRKFNKGMK